MHYAIALEILHFLFITATQNLSMIAFSYMKLWSFEVVKLDVCGTLVLSNLVTYIDSKTFTMNVLLE